MREVYVRTSAYNAEKTLRRAVDSILNQTYPHIKYYLLDNGSTDKTREIVREYAAKDSRVVPFYNDKNMVYGPESEPVNSMFKDIPDEALFCSLDADDEYDLTFIENALKFMDEHDLDIVCCGNRRLDASDGNKLVGFRKLDTDLILEDKAFCDLYHVYHSFTGATWGKLMKGRCVRNYAANDPKNLNVPDYGGDTYNVMSAFKLAKRVGIMAGTAHNYYINPASVSYRLTPKRVISDKIVYNAMIDFLQHYAPLSKSNRDFLLAAYMYRIRSTLKVVIRADMPFMDKSRTVLKVFTHNRVWQFILYPSLYARFIKKIIRKLAKR